MSILEPTEALSWDFKQQQLFVTYFNNLPEKPSSTVRFFNHTDFYSLQGDDAQLASDFTGNIVKYMGDDPKLCYVTLKKSQFELFIRELLLVRQYRVEVYVKTAANKADAWSVEFRGSPGNLAQFEEVLFDTTAMSFSNYVMGIRIVRNRVIAVACVNSTESKFQVGQLNDNECFTELEMLIAQIGPRECLIPSGDSPELVSLRKVLERNGVLLAPMKRADFNSNDVYQDLNRLLFFHDTQQRNAAGLPETQLEDAMGCLNAVIKFLNLTGDEQNFNQFKISTIDVHRFVRLDNAALYSLNILPKPGAATNVHDSTGLGPSSSKSFHLLGILDMCVTSQGRRLLEQWIKHPLKDANLINERLDIVKCLVKDPELRQVLAKDTLTRLNDLLMLSKKLSSKKATLQDCYKVYQIVGSVPKLVRMLKKAENNCVNSALVDPINEINADLEKFQSMVEEILDMDLVDRDEFLVKSTFDPDLKEIFDRKVRIEEKIQKQFRNAADDLGFDQDKTIKLECNEQYGYFFRVTLKEEHALRSSTRYQILGALKGGVRFTNDKLSDLNRDYEEVKKEYEEQQKSVISEIFDVAAGYSDTLRNLNFYVATVDVLVSFANVAVNAKIPYVRPIIHKEGTGILKLEKIRHPCLEQQDHIAFIPNSIEFSRGENDGKTFHIITGPNMCGKSTFIRSVGVCALMAQIGSFVPCQHAEISLVDAILARVGAEDCELKGLSTFMLEMIETATIIKTATANSLVIIDELGRGTSTYDGCGIAYAIAEHLAKEVKCFSLFATHFHEITNLADSVPGVNNLHVTAVTTSETITPLYQIRKGECDSSYGIHCARMADFPDDVIQLAVNHQKRLENAKGTQYIKDYEQVLKRKVIDDGDEIVRESLRKLKSLADSGASDGELANEIKKMKAELKKCDNHFIKGLLSH